MPNRIAPLRRGSVAGCMTRLMMVQRAETEERVIKRTATGIELWLDGEVYYGQAIGLKTIFKVGLSLVWYTVDATPL